MTTLTKPEIRYFKAEEVRMEGEDTPAPKVVAYGAVFNSCRTTSVDFARSSVPTPSRGVSPATRTSGFLINHDGLPLARSKSGTLQLFEINGACDLRRHSMRPTLTSNG